MRNSAIATIFYLTCTLVYKLFADNDNLNHVNLYWLYTSLVCYIIMNDLRHHTILKVYQRTFIAMRSYWGVMFALHVVCLFDIELYRYMSGANTITVGAAFIGIIFIYLISTLMRDDAKNER